MFGLTPTVNVNFTVTFRTINISTVRFKLGVVMCIEKAKTKTKLPKSPAYYASQSLMWQRQHIPTKHELPMTMKVPIKEGLSLRTATSQLMNCINALGLDLPYNLEKITGKAQHSTQIQ